MSIREHYGDIKLWYEDYPETLNTCCKTPPYGGNGCGCGGAKVGQFVPKCQRVPGVAYRNGVPYNCNCNKIQAPYSYPYASTKKCVRRGF